MLDLEGKKFGRLTAVRQAHKNKQSKYYWLFQCDCGRQTTVIPYDVTSGKTQSCGCYHVERASEANLKHGYSHVKGNSVYKIWIGMHDRCNRVTNKSYRYYGALGITYCSRWNSFENFLSDMGPRPSEEHTLERINPYGNYEPSNCKWATRSEQNNNNRRCYDQKQRASVLENL